MNKQKVIKNNIIIGIIALLIVGCSAAKHSELDCVKENQKDLVINCGTIYERTGGKIYKSINTNGIAFRVEEMGNGEKKFSDTIRLQPETYCYLKQRLENLAIKTSSMYYPGEIQEFIEYKNQTLNVSFRAIWNPQNIDYVENRKEAKALYDTLQSLCR